MAPTPLIPVVSFKLQIVTDTTPAAPQRFRPLVEITPQNGRPFFLNVETPEEFMAIAAMLQVPGQLFIEAASGQERNILIKQG
jgi:hypothetical protein